MFSVLFKLKWFFKAYRKQYTVAVVLLILASVIEVIPPWLLGEAIDDMTGGNFTGELLWFYIGAILLALVVSYAMNFVGSIDYLAGQLR